MWMSRLSSHVYIVNYMMLCYGLIIHSSIVLTWMLVAVATLVLGFDLRVKGLEVKLCLKLLGNKLCLTRFLPVFSLVFSSIRSRRPKYTIQM